MVLNTLHFVFRGSGNDGLLMGLNSDFDRSTYMVAERDDEDEDDEVSPMHIHTYIPMFITDCKLL